jgi:hypothetical protein
LTELIDLKAQMVDFINSNEYRELDAYFRQPCIFSIAGISLDEKIHSNMIKWFLDPKGNHELGEYPLRKFLTMLALICSTLEHASDKMPQDLLNAVITDDYELSKVNVELEKSLPDNTGRVDIFLKGEISFDEKTQSFSIAIENKVKSQETGNQTIKYRNELRSKTSIFLGVYLTPLGNREYETLAESECKAKEFIQLNYQYLADYMITPCRDQDLSERVKQYIDTYLLALQLPGIQEKGVFIMAFNNEAKELLVRFWEKHEKLLKSALKALTESDAIDEENRKEVEEAVKIIEKVRTYYDWSFEDRAESRQKRGLLAFSIVKDYIKHNEPMTREELKNTFQIDIGKESFFLPPEEARKKLLDKKRGRSRYRVKDEEIYSLSDGDLAIHNDFNIATLEKFRICAEKLGYKIQESKN